MRRERFILFEQGASIRRATDAFFKRVELSPDLALESNDTYFIKLMVEHGARRLADALVGRARRGRGRAARSGCASPATV